MNQQDFHTDNHNSYYSYDPSPSSGRPSPQTPRPSSQKDPDIEHLSTLSMVLGIIALVLMVVCLGCCGIGTVILSVLSIYYAIKARRFSEEHRFHGKMLAGLVCSIIALAYLALFVVIYAFIFGFAFIMTGFV